VLVLSRKKLLDAFSIVKSSVDYSGTFPVLENVHMSGTKLTAYNRITGVQTTLRVKGVNALIPFQKVFAFLKGISAEKVKMDVTEDKMVIQAGKARIDLTLTSAEQFPEFDKTIALLKRAKPLPEDFKEAVGHCYPFASKDNTSAHLMGIHVHDNWIEATDGKRISIYKGKKSFVQGKGGVIPTEMARILSNIGKVDKLYIGKKIIASCGDSVVFSSAITSDFPDVHRFIPEVPKLYDFPKEALIKGLRRIIDFTDESKELSFCKIEFGTSLKITYEGQVSEIKEVFNFGEVLHAEPFLVNPFLFLSMLSSCDKFSFAEASERGMLYGQSKDGRFKVVLSIMSQRS